MNQANRLTSTENSIEAHKSFSVLKALQCLQSCFQVVLCGRCLYTIPSFPREVLPEVFSFLLTFWLIISREHFRTGFGSPSLLCPPHKQKVTGSIPARDAKISSIGFHSFVTKTIQKSVPGIEMNSISCKGLQIKDFDCFKNQIVPWLYTHTRRLFWAACNPSVV